MPKMGKEEPENRKKWVRPEVSLAELGAEGVDPKLLLQLTLSKLFQIECNLLPFLFVYIDRDVSRNTISKYHWR